MGGFASDNIELEVGIHGHVYEGLAFSTPFAARDDFAKLGRAGAGGITESIKAILLSPEELVDHQAWLASRCQDDESETDNDNASSSLVNNDSVDNDEELTSMKSSTSIQNSKKKKVSVSTIHTKLYDMAPKYWNVDDTTVHTRFTISSSGGDDQQKLTVLKESEPIRGPKYYMLVDANRGATKIVHSAYPTIHGWEGNELEERGFEMIIGELRGGRI
jgi:hypothetical protein